MAFHPIDNFRNNLSNIGAHPFQSAARFGLGAINPALGMLAGHVFSGMNDRSFNNAMDTSTGRTALQGNQAAQQAMNKPLNGPLGQLGQGPDHSAMAQALTGGNGGNASGYNMGQQFASGQMTSPSSVLNFLPSQPATTPQGSFFTDPRYAPNQQAQGGGGAGNGGQAQGGSFSGGQSGGYGNYDSGWRNGSGGAGVGSGWSGADIGSVMQVLGGIPTLGGDGRHSFIR